MASRRALGIALGILALVCPAVVRAEIVYGAPAPGTGGFLANEVPGQLFSSAEYEVDLNGDGHPDLMFEGSYNGTMPFINRYQTSVVGTPGFRFTEDSGGPVLQLAKPIDAGTVMGPGTSLGPDTTVVLADYGILSSITGPPTQFSNGNPAWMSGPHYLGFSFVSADGTHYGWVNLSYEAVSAWAYESAPGTPIVVGAVPEPVAGGLMLGVMLALPRRREE